MQRSQCARSPSRPKYSFKTSAASWDEPKTNYKWLEMLVIITIVFTETEKVHTSINVAKFSSSGKKIEPRSWDGPQLAAINDTAPNSKMQQSTIISSKRVPQLENISLSERFTSND